MGHRAIPTRSASDEGVVPTRTRSRRGNRANWGLSVFAVLLTAAATWFAVSAHRSNRALRAARSELSTLEAAHARATLELKSASTELAEGRASRSEMSMQLAAAQSQLDLLEHEHSSTDAQLEELRKMASRFQSMVDSGQLEVAFRRGRMVVELPAQLLFPSGSADLTPEGSAALSQVAQVLREVRGRRFLVYGHTDTVPVTGDKFASNWELSVARALNVTEALIHERVQPRQLTAAGRAQYEPIASNTTARGRQKNRRIEIILEPHLVEVERASERGAVADDAR